ncbi:MAG: hypothetical protein AAGF90_09195 [Pseudomonadota bacterium]
MLHECVIGTLRLQQKELTTELAVLAAEVDAKLAALRKIEQGIAALRLEADAPPPKLE